VHGVACVQRGQVSSAVLGSIRFCVVLLSCGQGLEFLLVCCAEAWAIVYGLLDRSPSESWVHATVVGMFICLCARRVARPSMVPLAKSLGVEAMRDVD
jgi:hypothetical protein